MDNIENIMKSQCRITLYSYVCGYCSFGLSTQRDYILRRLVTVAAVVQEFVEVRYGLCGTISHASVTLSLFSNGKHSE